MRMRVPAAGAFLLFLSPVAFSLSWAGLWLFLVLGIFVFSREARLGNSSPLFVCLLFYSMIFFLLPNLAREWIGLLPLPLLVGFWLRNRRFWPVKPGSASSKTEPTIPVFASALVCVSVATSFYLMILSSKERAFLNFLPALSDEQGRWLFFLIALVISVAYGLLQEILVRGWIWHSLESSFSNITMLTIMATSGFCLVAQNRESGSYGFLALSVTFLFHLGLGWLRHWSNGLFWPCVARSVYEFLLVSLLFLLDR